MIKFIKLKIKKCVHSILSISELEYSKFGLKEDNFSFSELLDIVSREIARDNLRKSIQLAEKYGISKITMEEIDEEIKAVRENAKSNT